MIFCHTSTRYTHYFANKGPSSQGYGFSNSHVWMWELDCEESWPLRNWQQLWCWRRLLRVPWTARRSNQSILKEISPGCSLEGMMLKLKLQVFWPPHARSWLIGKDCDAGRDWGQEEKGMTEDGMDGWHHRLNGHEFEQAPGVGDGKESCAAVHVVTKNWTQLSDWTTRWLMSLFLILGECRESVLQTSAGSLLSNRYPNPSQHQNLFQWVNSSHEVAKVLEFQL